jgi:IS5 family transposase
VTEGRATLTPPGRDEIETELEMMNEGKKGRPFMYPDCIVTYAWKLYILLGKDYRFIEGILDVTLSCIMDRIPDYTTIWRRVSCIVTPDPCPASGHSMTVSLDSTGIGLSPKGAWVSEKYGEHKDWMKLHAAVDVLTMRIVSFVITGKRVSDNLAAEGMLDEIGRHAKIEAMLGDGAYDTKRIFRYLGERGIRAIIRVRKNSATASKGCVYRGAHVREVKGEGGHAFWKEGSGYRVRSRSETVFSMVKGSTGEDTRSRTLDRVRLEIAGKVWVHNSMIDARA